MASETRSDLGRRCRDTFASLKKTFRKLGIAFWDYFGDRLSGNNMIPSLPELIRRWALESPGQDCLTPLFYHSPENLLGTFVLHPYILVYWKE